MTEHTSVDVLIIGAGAAGLMAAAAAAERGRTTLVLEKNRKIGVKILMSGGTRCNITHHCGARELADEFRQGARFLYKAIGQLPPEEVVRIVEAEGVLTKVEDTGKVFPVSDRALDVRDALWRRAERAGAQFRTETAVQGVARTPEGFQVTTAEGEFLAQALILCCGGKSYPGCGTTGDGYAWARHFGHTIRQLHPALTPLTTDEPWVRELSGITLERVRCEILREGEAKPLGSRVGSLLFTHTGLSGPEPMNLSRFVTALDAPARRLRLDFFPDQTGDQLLALWREKAKTHGKASVLAVALGELPGRLAEYLLARAGLPLDLKLAELSKAQGERLKATLKGTEIQLSGTRGYDKAEVTAGGVDLAEVNPATMESRLVPGLYFAGEILDVDGPIGGYNFQAAFATGTMAGRHA